MSEICSCDSYSLGNMGGVACTPVASETARLILTRYFKDDATIPAILTSDEIDDDFWDEHIQRYDNAAALVAADERWYITPTLENAEDVRADAVYQDFNSGAKVKVRDGIRSMTFFIKNGTPELLQKILKFQCIESGVWLVDNKGQLIGNGSVSGELRPLRIDMASFNAQLVKATGGNTVQGIMIMFDLHRFEQDHDLKLITAEDMEVSPLDLLGLVDVYPSAASSVTTTGFSIQLNSGYGSFLGVLPIRGLVAGDFTLAEVSPTPGSIAIVSCTESTSTPGLYSFTFAAQTTGDVLKLTLKKDGLDGELIEAVVITIP